MKKNKKRILSIPKNHIPIGEEQETFLGEVVKIGKDLLAKVESKEGFFYVRGLNLGDQVEFTKLSRGNSHRFQVAKAYFNSDRSSVFCKEFLVCGGCSGQHLGDAEWSLKTQPIQTAISEQYQIASSLNSAYQRKNYRNRMDFVAFDGRHLGLRGQGSFKKLVDLSECHLDSKISFRERERIRALLEEFPLGHNRTTREGILKYATIRVGVNTGDSIVILNWIESSKNSQERKIFLERFLEVSESANVINCYSKMESEVSTSKDFEVVRGNSFYKEKILDAEFTVPYDGFFQPNPIGFTKILLDIQNTLEKWKVSDANLLDLFCGSGFFSKFFHQKFKKVLGVDSNLSSIREANSLEIGKFLCMDLVREDLVLDEGNWIGILDPPRAGLGKRVVQAIANYPMEFLFYVSCNPYSQLEDLKELKASYDLQSYHLYDLYPGTPHLESLAILKRKTI